MRLFVGLDLPEETIRNLEALLARLRPTARIHWSPPANLHITTKFIGEWPDERVEEVKAALAAIEPAHRCLSLRFTCRLSTTGARLETTMESLLLSPL